MIETSYMDCLLWCADEEFLAIWTSQKLIKLHHKVVRSGTPGFLQTMPYGFAFQVTQFSQPKSKVDRLFATSAVTCFEREFGPHHPKYILWALTKGKTPVKSNQCTFCLYLLLLSYHAKPRVIFRLL